MIPSFTYKPVVFFLPFILTFYLFFHPLSHIGEGGGEGEKVQICSEKKSEMLNCVL